MSPTKVGNNVPHMIDDNHKYGLIMIRPGVYTHCNKKCCTGDK